jgi:hypothetical protein
MYRFIRSATIKTFADLPAALKFASEVTSYMNKSHSVNMKFGFEVYGEHRIHWHFDSESPDKIRDINSKIIKDHEYWGIIKKSEDIFVDGSQKDMLLNFPD